MTEREFAREMGLRELAQKALQFVSGLVAFRSEAVILSQPDA
jgi:hypothetical protein